MIVTLITDIAFTSVCGKDVNLKTGSRVYVDTEALIACWNGIHFDIGRDEFTHYLH
jgi:hypothetical protein